MASHARKNAARRQEDLTGTNRRAALQDIRNTIPPTSPAPKARSAGRATASEADTAVPAELIALVQDFVRWGRRHLDDAARAAHQHIDRPEEWHRLVLYALTDALSYNFLLVGTLAAYLQDQGVDGNLLRRHLQSPDPDRYVSQEALDLLAGLMGKPVAEGKPEPTWHFIGRQIAQCGVDRGGEGSRPTQR